MEKIYIRKGKKKTFNFHIFDYHSGYPLIPALKRAGKGPAGEVHA
jgi:hypothetical protein